MKTQVNTEVRNTRKAKQADGIRQKGKGADSRIKKGYRTRQAGGDTGERGVIKGIKHGSCRTKNRKERVSEKVEGVKEEGKIRQGKK